MINVMVLTTFAPVPVVATVQTVVVVEVKATGRLDEAVALCAFKTWVGTFNDCEVNGGLKAKVMVCGALLTVNDFATWGAAK